jgi:hypothetical protein
MAAILTTSGRIGLAASVKARVAHLAWGIGNPAWGNTPPPPPVDASTLVSEVGRRQATSIDYCLPDNAGPIVVPDGRFVVTQTPTNHLYFRFFFEFEEGLGSVIREQAIFLDTVKAPNVPAGKFYLAPSEVADPGRMLVIQRSAPIVREITTRQLFEIVVTL